MYSNLRLCHTLTYSKAAALGSRNGHCLQEVLHALPVDRAQSSLASKRHKRSH